MGRPSKFDVGFRAHAVELVRMSQRPRCQIASELGVSDTTLGKWMSRSNDEKAPDALTIGEKAELEQLRVVSPAESGQRIVVSLMPPVLG